MKKLSYPEASAQIKEVILRVGLTDPIEKKIFVISAIDLMTESGEISSVTNMQLFGEFCAKFN